MLHTVNKSGHASPLLRHCLQQARTGDAVLLLNDGVYGGTLGSPCAEQIERLASGGDCLFYALEEDVDKRGMGSLLLPSIMRIDYAAFVALACQHRHTQSWF